MSTSNNTNDADCWMITLVDTESGASETVPIVASTTLADLLELVVALFDNTHDRQSRIVLYKDGKPLITTPTTTTTTMMATAQSLGIQSGDVLAVQSTATTTAVTATRTTSNTSLGGLDFSNLLQTSSSSSSTPAATASGLDFSSLLAANSTTMEQPPKPVYYQGMHLQEAMHYNPHPHAFVRTTCIYDIL